MANTIDDALDTPDIPIAEAGAGVKVAENPLAGLIRTVQKEEFDAATPAPKAGAVAGVAGTAAELIAKAKQFVGTPYKWGGTSPLGFDCSGFTQYVFRQFGVNLPRISYQQGQGGSAVGGRDQWQPGDLLFWDNSSRNNGADHVAIYIGGGLILHAPKPGDRVKISPVFGSPWARRYL